MAANNRKIILVNKDFQLRSSFYACSWLFAGSVVYPVIIYMVFDYFARLIPLDPQGRVKELILRNQTEIIWLLIGFQVVYMLLAFLINIFVSHRIAGPLYKLRKAFQTAMHSTIDGVTFRKYDYFQELATDFTSLMQEQKAQQERKNHMISDAISELDRIKDGIPAAGKEQLEKALNFLHEAQK